MNPISKTQKTLLILLMVMLTAIGYSQEKVIKHRYSESIQINQPANKVWNVITDPTQWNK